MCSSAPDSSSHRVCDSLFQLFNRFELLDTRIGLIIAYTTFSLPYAVWIMQSFFAGIPTDLDDAARIVGARGWGRSGE
jgi:multiple sugar transport system permease protein